MMSKWKWTLAALAVVALGSTGVGIGLAAASGGGENEGPGGPVPLVGAIGSNELDFVPVEPCRVADTRSGGGIVAAGATRTFEVRGTTGFPAQGGTSGGCGVPAAATAAELTVISTGSTGAGYLRAFPFGGTPSATTVQFTAGVGILNTGAVGLCTSSCTKDLSVKAFNASTHVVIDVTGYYVPPLWAVVGSDGAIDRSSRATSSSNLGSVGNGSYEVVFDRSIVGCAYTANSGDSSLGTNDNFVSVTNRVSNANAVFVEVYNHDGAPADGPFMVSVSC